ncbi:MAG: hypothetical protein GY940_07875 [bacterium]|nr:hypothetical protein [bacterium]
MIEFILEAIVLALVVGVAGNAIYGWLKRRSKGKSESGNKLQDIKVVIEPR